MIERKKSAIVGRAIRNIVECADTLVTFCRELDYFSDNDDNDPFATLRIRLDFGTFSNSASVFMEYL
jgi:hypothetical protein